MQEISGLIKAVSLGLVLAALACGSGSDDPSSPAITQDSLISSGPNPSIPGLLQVVTWPLSFGSHTIRSKAYEIIGETCNFSSSQFDQVIPKVIYSNGEVNSLNVSASNSTVTFECNGIPTEAKLLENTPRIINSALTFAVFPYNVHSYIIVPENEMTRSIVSAQPTRTFISAYSQISNQYLTLSPNSDGAFVVETEYILLWQAGLIIKNDVLDMDFYPSVSIGIVSILDN